MILRIMRWIRGYVIFTVTGRFPERFINLLNRNGIRYWGMMPRDKSYCASMSLKDYKNIRRIAKRCSVRLSHQKAVGLPFLIERYKPRVGLLAGGVAGLIIMVLLNQHIWAINVNGIKSLSDVQVKTALRDAGLYEGVLKSTIDIEEIERKVSVSLKNVKWISINALNNVARVEIRERAKSPKIEDTSYPCNIKASCDGVITDIAVSRGNCTVKRGSAVMRNQLLVSSVIEENENKLKYVHSQAEIYADVIETLEYETDLKSKDIILLNNYTEKADLNFFGFYLPFKTDFSHTGTKVSTFHTTGLNPNGVILPVNLSRQREYKLSQKTVNNNIKKGKKILQKKINIGECFKIKNATIKSRKITYIKKGNKLTACVRYVVNKNIAKTQKISVKAHKKSKHKIENSR